MSRLGGVATSVDLDSDRYDWRDFGACIGHPDINFFPERSQDTAAAKAVCKGCPVREVCLEVALRNGEKFGIWGGLSERERRRLRKARNAETADGRSGDRNDLGDRIVAELERRGGTWWTTVGGIATHFGAKPTAVTKTLSVLRTDEVITTTTGTYGDTTTPVIVTIHLNEGTTP